MFKENDMLNVGDKAPGFSLPDKENKEVSLGKNQKQRIHDLLKALYKTFNQEFVDWQPAVIHVVKTQRDTLYVPETKGKK